MKNKKNKILIAIGLICFILQFLMPNRVEAATEKSPKNAHCISVLPLSDLTDVRKLNSGERISITGIMIDSSISSLNSTYSESVPEQSTSDENQKEKKDDKKSNESSLLSVLLGGLIAIAGTLVTAHFTSVEADKQRKFQYKIEKLQRTEEAKKELMLYKRQAYTDFMKYIGDLNKFYEVYDRGMGPRNDAAFKEGFDNLTESYSRILLISSQAIVDSTKEIVESINIDREKISAESIRDIAEKMRIDLTPDVISNRTAEESEVNISDTSSLQQD